MYYPDELVDDVLRRNDIVDVIGSYMSLKRAGSNYQGLCPFHNEKTPSFSVSQNKQIFKCFGCGKGGNVLSFVMEYENMNFTEALSLLAERAGVTLPKADNSEEAKRQANYKASMKDVYKKAAIYFHKVLKTEAGKEGYQYLKRRGLSDETIIRFGLGFSPASHSKLYVDLKADGYKDDMLKDSALFNYTEANGISDRFWNRVMFPIMDINNKVIAFGGRVMGDGKPKYLNSNETVIFDKSRNLYAMNLARKSRRGYALLCEGYMDVISLHQAGFDNAVASLGTALTTLQANLLKRYFKQAIITYDSDGAGRSAALRAIPILRAAGISTKVLNMEPYKDPDEFIKALGSEEYEKRISQAIPGFFYECDCLKKEYESDDPETITKFHNALAKKHLMYSDELERTTYIHAICARYKIDEAMFTKLVNKMAAGLEVAVSEAPVVRSEEKNATAKACAKYDKELLECEKVILTWSVEDDSYRDLFTEYLTAEDFEEGVPRRIVELALRHVKENNGKIAPASIICHFEETTEQAIVSDVFQADIWNQFGDDRRGRQKAFADAVMKCLQASNSKKMTLAGKNNDGKLLQECMNKKIKLKNVSKEILNKLA